MRIRQGSIVDRRIVHYGIPEICGNSQEFLIHGDNSRNLCGLADRCGQGRVLLGPNHSPKGTLKTGNLIQEHPNRGFGTQLTPFPSMVEDGALELRQRSAGSTSETAR